MCEMRSSVGCSPSKKLPFKTKCFIFRLLFLAVVQFCSVLPVLMKQNLCQEVKGMFVRGPLPTHHAHSCQGGLLVALLLPQGLHSQKNIRGGTSSPWLLGRVRAVT